MWPTRRVPQCFQSVEYKILCSAAEMSSLRTPRRFAVQVCPSAAITILILLAWSDSTFGSRSALFATVLLIASLVVHELGHTTMAMIHRVRVSAIGMSFLGTYIRRERARSRWAESLIALAGPIASVGVAAIFAMGDGRVCSWLAQMNAVVAISNLVPIFGTDGDRILNAICAPAAAR